MSRVERIQEEKARTLSRLSGSDNTDTSGPLPGQFSSDSGDSPESGNIRVISSVGDTLSDVGTGLSNIASDTFSSIKDFSSGIFSGKSKEERKAEFQDQQTSSTISGNSATVDPTRKFLGPYSQGPVQEISVEEAIAQGDQSDDTTEKQAKGSNSTIPNPLEVFASYNCIFTLGVLSPASVNDARSTYRKNGATYTILRSGGGGIDQNRITTGFEENGNLEYFIDDFVMESILSPNQQTGISLGTRLSFKVYEPYSLGLFLQSLEIAAVKAGYQNYLKAPFLLEINFLGWDENGNSRPVQYSSRKIPFKLLNVEFNVDSGGSVYDVEGIPWNEQTLTDTVQTTKDPVEIRGATVAEALSFGDQSLTAVINQKQREQAEKDELPLHDLYVVRFPKSRVKGRTNAFASDTPGSATISKENSVPSSVVSTAQFKSRIGNFFSESSGEANNNIYQTLVGETTTDINRIGSSTMVENYNQGSNHPFPRGLYTYDKEAQVYRRDGIELSLSDNERTFKFPQGMTIQKIIEEMVLISNYGENATKALDKEGMATWFKVETECYILESSEVEESLGRKPYVYVFNVVPYKVHGGIVSAPNKGVPGAEERAKQVSKRYNYIYSGQNKDVLSFDIQFRTAFYESVRADRGNERDSKSRNQEDEKTEKGVDSSPGDVMPDYTVENVSETGTYTGGGSETDAKKNLAKQFHNTLLNSNADLITANVEIWGDPYYLPDSGMGNFSSRNSGLKATLTEDGSIDYQRNEIDVLVNFRTPVDYKPNGEMSFQSDTTTINGFSGFYKVTSVESKISGNKFTQTLEMIRRRNQTLDGIGGKSVVEKQNATRSEGGRAEQTGSAPSTERTTGGPGAGSAAREFREANANSFASDTPSGTEPVYGPENSTNVGRSFPPRPQEGSDPKAIPDADQARRDQIARSR